MKRSPARLIGKASVTDVYALYQLDNGGLLCAQRDGLDYIVCFTEKADAERFRNALGASEHCGIIGQPMQFYPSSRLYLDERFIDLGTAVRLTKSLPAT